MLELLFLEEEFLGTQELDLEFGFVCRGEILF
jgi:hypothetical protein